MAWAAERFDEHRAIGATAYGTESGSLWTKASDGPPPRSAVHAGIDMRIPVDAARGQIERVVVAVDVARSLGLRRPRGGISRRSIQVETAAADEGDGLAQGCSHGGKKLFIVVKGHGYIPFPWGDQKKSRRRASSSTRDKP